MDWVLLSLASAAAFAVVSILDKVLLTRFVTDARAFIVLVGVIQFGMAAAALPLASFSGLDGGGVLVAFVSGALWGVSLVAMFWVLSTQDVSRVIPVVSAAPVFVAIMAVVFLSEQLGPLQWVAILVTVAGAGLISLRAGGSGGRPTLSPSFLVLVLSAATFAGGQFMTKVALDEMDLWTVLVIRNLGLGTVAMLIPFRPSVLPAIRRAVSEPATLTVLIATEGFLVFGALVVTFRAIELGPVSLVATLMATRPLFVFIMSVVLSTAVWRLLDEPLDRPILLQKLVSTAMIVGGVVAIAVT